MQTIRFGDDGQVATRELMRQFEQLGPRIAEATSPAMEKLRGELKTLDAIDRQYGGNGPLPLEGIDEVVGAALTDLAHLESDCRREGHDASLVFADLVVGAALWAVRHEVPVVVAEPVTNALALMSNAAGGKAELAAVFGVMQGIIDNLRPSLHADLERSNPVRPWRLLHVNLAITAIRTEDPAMIQYAFDALDAALPDERAGFYAEALALAMAPDVAPAVREHIEERHRRWNLS
ncbi:MAG: hypothetical protein ABIR73_10270 [Usitatibacter sp.]